MNQEYIFLKYLYSGIKGLKSVGAWLYNDFIVVHLFFAVPFNNCSIPLSNFS